MSFLLDTNVVSELRKRDRANQSVVAWFRPRRREELYISVLTLGELRRGVERVRRRDPATADVLENWLGRTSIEFGDRIIAVDENIADRWGRLGTPDPVPAVDGLIAATALERDLVVVSRDRKHFSRIGVPHLNPFEAPARA